MSPKKKPATSSDSTSNSSSSSSSSNSSSSSGSDSSSSDSENSSASQASGAKSGGRSTDSDSRRSTAKKKPAQNSTSLSSNSNTSSAATAAKSNAKADGPSSAAGLESTQENAKKAAKTRAGAPKGSQVYSSEEDDLPTKTAGKRKGPSKPKVSATVTPQQRPTKPPAKGSQSKANPGKNNSAQKAAPAKETPASSKGNASKQADKKNKTKSIFSPENSSESEGPSSASKAPPPKGMANKVAAALNQKGKQKKEPAVVSDKSAASSATSGSDSSSGSSSSSDSDSSAESTAAPPKPVVTTPVKKGPGRPPKKSPVTPIRNQGRNANVKSIKSTPPNSSSNSNSNSNSGTPAAGGDSVRAGSESEADHSKSSPEKSKPDLPAIRKVTRSATNNARRSKHLIGKSALGSDSESDGEGKTGLSKNPVKKVLNSKAPPRKTKGKGLPAPHSETGAKIIPEEDRKCPYEGCDSKGHLSGMYEKHYIIEACPLYHNKTPEECKNAYTERAKKNEERQRFLTAILERRSPKTHQSLEQRNYMLKVKELRDKDRKCRKKRKNSSSDSGSESSSSSSSEEEADEEDSGQREPKLAGVAPMYDIGLFQEAQAMTSHKLEEDLKSLPFTKGTKYIEMGKHEMEVWYQSPYPDDYARLPKLYLCEFCLRYMKSSTILKRHAVKCVWRHPPGKEVYRKDKLSVWEVDGKRYKLYCQNLCLLAKFFLDHKTLYYDVEPFLFYVMTLNDGDGCHTVGYFSKEKNSFQNYNVSCILTLPPYQRQGFGRLLIDFSYLLTRQEGKMGSPEKPLSDLGLISYRSYWKDVLLEYLCNFGGKELLVKDISQEMAINPNDIVSTLQAMGMIKYWKGKHIILKKQDVMTNYREKKKRRKPEAPEVTLDPQCLRWKPYVVTASPAS